MYFENYTVISVSNSLHSTFIPTMSPCSSRNSLIDSSFQYIIFFNLRGVSELEKHNNQEEKNTGTYRCYANVPSLCERRRSVCRSLLLFCLSCVCGESPLHFFNIQETGALCQLSGQLVERPCLPGFSLHVPPKK